ncbi:MAG: DNA-processing protein DprA [Muribaculum sp.]|nr:DNA-processing protein DprA [Muribaculum sp.]
MDIKGLQIAFSMLEHTGTPLFRLMEEVGLGLQDFFAMPDSNLSKALGIDAAVRIPKAARSEALAKAQEEMAWIEKHSIRAVAITDPDYPFRLLDTEDAPIILYVLGNADLNAKHGISIVGTRRSTPYGLKFTDNLIESLASSLSDVCITSGLAYGIDAAAHTAALQYGVPTVAVVAHGLHMIYPATHRSLAGRIVHEGGAIVSEYPHGARPFRNRFLERNRIVGCINQAVVVVESDFRGGAMSTAADAFSYDRDVFAVPGRVSDQQSRGTNHLISTQKAQLLTEADDLILAMGWSSKSGSAPEARQLSIFPTLDGDEKIVYDVIKEAMDPLTSDRIHSLSSIPMARVMAALSELEFNGLILRMPGNRYSMLS